jgi:hypothetical protein
MDKKVLWNCHQVEAGNILIHLPRQEVDFSRLVPKIGLVVSVVKFFTGPQLCQPSGVSIRMQKRLVQGMLKGKYHCTIDLLFYWFVLVSFANKNKNC